MKKNVFSSISFYISPLPSHIFNRVNFAEYTSLNYNFLSAELKNVSLDYIWFVHISVLTNFYGYILRISPQGHRNDEKALIFLLNWWKMWTLDAFFSKRHKNTSLCSPELSLALAGVAALAVAGFFSFTSLSLSLSSLLESSLKNISCKYHIEKDTFKPKLAKTNSPTRNTCMNFNLIEKISFC